MNDDEVTLKRFQNLFKIAARAFYDEMAVVAVDYMVLNCKASLTEDQMEQYLKLPIKKLRAAFHRMKEDEIIREDPILKRWTLTSNIKELLQLRLDAIKEKLAERISATNIKKYKCVSCSEVVLASVMALNQGKCPNCRSDLIEMERDSNVYMKLKDVIKKIEDYIEACKGRDFPAKMYPEEYHKLWESANKGPENPLPIMINTQDKVLYKKVIEKLNEQRKGKNVIKADDNLLSEAVTLQEYYKSHPTKLNTKLVTTADLLKKRKATVKLGDREYQDEYSKYLKKIKIL